MIADTSRSLDVATIAPMDHDEAMQRAAVEMDRLLELVGWLADDEWSRPTECPGLRVRDILAHLLGM